MSVTRTEVQDWVQELSQAINAETPVSLMHCLETAAQQQPSVEFRERLAVVSYLVGNGFSLSSALAVYGNLFEPNILTVIRYGELYGELEDTLQRYVQTMNAHREAMQTEAG